MRYFVNTNAAKPVVAGGVTFEFELADHRGGSWLGVLALDEPGASILAAAAPSSVGETSIDRYEKLKKKSSPPPASFPSLRRPTSPRSSVAVADRVGSLSGRVDSKVVEQRTLVGITSVSLMTTTNMPPNETLLSDERLTGRKNKRSEHAVG